ncbi:hypothetical protein U27_04957 [Candidatus Vecturithrix granuli]|uniref:Uncharacterized protein n=1 Tax=Vecturithrix granuli TaxID=1499967 RepID=A0A081C079_VECG1|nr:hypothetical protein U27_04957 [Candidatus Vecturithrix granuli]
MQSIETDITVIQQHARRNEDENRDFRAFLKGCEISDIDPDRSSAVSADCHSQVETVQHVPIVAKC